MNWGKSGKTSYKVSEIEQAKEDKSRPQGNGSGKRKETKILEEFHKRTDGTCHLIGYGS